MQRARLKIAAGYEQFGDWSLESGYQAMQRLLDLPAPPSAVFVCNDLMAIGVLDAVQQRGLRVPKDIAVVGFDDIPAASWVRPRLTTIAQYPGEMGVRLATAIFERILGEYSGPGRRFEVPCRLVQRESA
jgi:DNA-binding LacI/PurR family transcriptional regulator